MYTGIRDVKEVVWRVRSSCAEFYFSRTVFSMSGSLAGNTEQNWWLRISALVVDLIGADSLSIVEICPGCPLSLAFEITPEDFLIIFLQP